MTDKDDNGVKKPAEDSHLKYLAYVQDQLSAQGDKEEPDPILSVCSVGKVNQYQKQWADWQKTYMTKKINVSLCIIEAGLNVLDVDDSYTHFCVCMSLLM